MDNKLFKKWDTEDERDLARMERARLRYVKARDKADEKEEKKSLKRYEKELNRGFDIL